MVSVGSIPTTYEQQLWDERDECTGMSVRRVNGIVLQTVVRPSFALSHVPPPPFFPSSLLPSIHLFSLYLNLMLYFLFPPTRYVRNAKFLNEQSRPGILMMSRCLLEMYGADLRSSYQHAFIYIRQLAIHLRGAITKRTRESLRNVYNWQYVRGEKVLELV